MEINVLVQCLLVIKTTCWFTDWFLHSFVLSFISTPEVCCNVHRWAAAESFQCCVRADGKSQAGQRALWAQYKDQKQSRSWAEEQSRAYRRTEDSLHRKQKWKWSWHVCLSLLQSSSHASASSRPQPFPSHRWASALKPHGRGHAEHQNMIYFQCLIYACFILILPWNIFTLWHA